MFWFSMNENSSEESLIEKTPEGVGNVPHGNLAAGRNHTRKEKRIWAEVMDGKLRLRFFFL